MHRFCIINCLDEAVELRQTDTRETLFVEPFHSEGWHKTEASGSSTVQLRTQSSLWSYGSIDVNEIGGSILLLPNVSSSSNLRLIVVHVEVNRHFFICL